MLKDLALALILGVVVGFGLTGGFFTWHNRSKTTQISPTPIPQPATFELNLTPSPQFSVNNMSLNILEPENNALVNTTKIKITGQSSPQARIIINTPTDVLDTTADEEGNFTSTVNLEIGLNQIQVTAIDSNDNQNETNLTITYSTNKFLPYPSTSTSDDKTQELRDISKQKAIDSLQKAFWGNITQINNSQITIKQNDTDYQLTVDDNTVVVNETGNKIKLNSLKTNQTILAMGFYDPTTNTLTTKRINLIDSQIIEKKYQVVVGNIADISQETSILTIIPAKNKEMQYQVKNNNKDLKIGDKIIVSLISDPKTANTYLALHLIKL